MSQQNVEVVRALAEAFQRRDHELPFNFYDPDIEWDSSGRTVGVGPVGIYRGHDGVRAFWREWLSAWSDIEFDIEDVRDAGDEVVLLVRDQRQWGRSSGLVSELPPYAMVFTFHEGKIVRWRDFPDQESALKVVGLEG